PTPHVQRRQALLPRRATCTPPRRNRCPHAARTPPPSTSRRWTRVARQLPAARARAPIGCLGHTSTRGTWRAPAADVAAGVRDIARIGDLEWRLPGYAPPDGGSSVARRLRARSPRGSSVSRGRLEAFSDGVIAVVITIMVLNLDPPEGSSLHDLRPLVPK